MKGEQHSISMERRWNFFLVRLLLRHWLAGDEGNPRTTLRIHVVSDEIFTFLNVRRCRPPGGSRRLLVFLVRTLIAQAGTVAFRAVGTLRFIWWRAEGVWELPRLFYNSALKTLIALLKLFSTYLTF